MSVKKIFLAIAGLWFVGLGVTGWLIVIHNALIGLWSFKESFGLGFSSSICYIAGAMLLLGLLGKDGKSS